VEKIRIVVDSREARSDIPTRLKRFERAEVEVLELEIGDYLIAEGMVIERKTANDLVASIMDGRLIGQSELLKSAYLRPIVLLEGDPYTVRSAIEPAAITGAISHLIVNLGIAVIPSPNAERSSEIIFTCARHASVGLGYVPPLRGSKPRDAALMARYLLEGLPSVGPNTAAALLAKFGSAHAVFAADVAELRTVKGIGEKTAQRIVEALRAPVVDLRP
jgi:fanconi anemia group M protein